MISRLSARDCACNSLLGQCDEQPLFDIQAPGVVAPTATGRLPPRSTPTPSATAPATASAAPAASTSPHMYSAQSGYRTQGDAGLSLVGARCYDAQVGRFITRDTLLDQKTYLYCEHDPVNATDPSGHFGGFWEIVGVLVGGVGVVIEAPVLIVVAGVAEFGGVEERRSIYHLSGVNAALFRDLGECCLVGSERL